MIYVYLGLEVFYQTSLQIVLLLLTHTDTATTSGLQTFFQQSRILGLNPSVILCLSIAWSLRTSIKLHVKTIKTQKVMFRLKPMFLTGLWGLVASGRRVLSIVSFFTPCLGLFNLLSHWLAEQYTFSIRGKYNLIQSKDEIHLYNSSEPLYWKDLDRWNYYGDPQEPTPPSYATYTGFTLQWYYLVFLVMMSFHFASLALVKTFTSAEFRKERTFNKCIHLVQNMNIAAPYKDWDEAMVSREEFRRRHRDTEREMAWALAVNNLFSIAMLLPIWSLGKRFRLDM